MGRGQANGTVAAAPGCPQSSGADVCHGKRGGKLGLMSWETLQGGQRGLAGDAPVPFPGRWKTPRPPTRPRWDAGEWPGQRCHRLYRAGFLQSRRGHCRGDLGGSEGLCLASSPFPPPGPCQSTRGSDAQGCPREGVPGDASGLAQSRCVKVSSPSSGGRGHLCSLVSHAGA